MLSSLLSRRSSSLAPTSSSSSSSKVTRDADGREVLFEHEWSSARSLASMVSSAAFMQLTVGVFALQLFAVKIAERRELERMARDDPAALDAYNARRAERSEFVQWLYSRPSEKYRLLLAATAFSALALVCARAAVSRVATRIALDRQRGVAVVERLSFLGGRVRGEHAIASFAAGGSLTRGVLVARAPVRYLVVDTRGATVHRRTQLRALLDGATKKQ